MRIVAVLTAYHPDERLAAVVESALQDCAAVVVADNTPAPAPSLAEKLDDPRVTVLPIGRNLGLGGALNRAVAELPQDAEIGSSVNVEIVTQQKDDTLIIPRSGLRSYLGRTFVRVLEEEKRIREIDVEQGLVTPTTVEILKGLEEGQEVILQ